MKSFEEYSVQYGCARMERHDGILQVTLHTDGRSMEWNEAPHRELPHVFTDIGNDPDNHVVIITGIGDTFIGHSFGPYYPLWMKPPPGTNKEWTKTNSMGQALLGREAASHESSGYRGSDRLRCERPGQGPL